MPKEFRILPRCLARRKHAPGCDRVFEARNGRQRIAKQTDMQRFLGEVNQTI